MTKIIKKLIFVILIAPLCLMAQESVMIDYEVKGNKVEILYLLQADSSKEYEISLVVKRSLAENFIHRPIMLSGDIGVGKFAGVQRAIVWNLTQKEIETMQFDDLYFEIIADEISEASSWPWYYYATGAGIIATAIYLIIDVEKEITPFPLPPGPPISK